jgi:hypothetical protein
MTAAEKEDARRGGPAAGLPDPADARVRGAGGQKATDRAQMVERDIRGRGVSDPAVLLAMGSVPRRLFVDPNNRDLAYGDHPSPSARARPFPNPISLRS